MECLLFQHIVSYDSIFLTNSTYNYGLNMSLAGSSKVVVAFYFIMSMVHVCYINCLCIFMLLRGGAGRDAFSREAEPERESREYE